MALAEAFGGTIVNADSMQVYRELRVLTARPSPDDEARTPHRLYGVLPGTERCSAGRWVGLAVSAIQETWQAGRLPLVVGGTGLYLKALREGLSPIPLVPAAVRAEARRLREALGPERFRAAVAALDPESAQRLPAGDTQRLARAWEVATATGIPLSRWQRQSPPRAPIRARFLTLAATPSRAGLTAAIDARFDLMIQAGALDEVARLLSLDLDPTLPVMRAAGVRELAGYLRKETSLADACTAAKRQTRLIAKRQMTWLRHQMDVDLPVAAQHSETLDPKIYTFIRQFLLTEAG